MTFQFGSLTLINQLQVIENTHTHSHERTSRWYLSQPSSTKYQMADTAVANGAPKVDADLEEPKIKCLIQVSNTKKPLYFYVNLSKRMLQEHGKVELSGLGLAVQTVVNVAEILKGLDLVVVHNITTGMQAVTDDPDKAAPKPKIQVILHKSEQFDDLMKKQAELQKKAAGEA
eukprot:TRINITY_DN1227_c0_g2_i1.p2 TRINITY_DN1227_c0_g2~~TRINITY_DN1227_c0_g2_i1.p2  ORF type:complete len:173 (-),score=23.39 TRINITY_DN1227_c0_g2_i1:254-772(-)